MSWFSDLNRSAVGRKAVMAVTGIILFGFVFVHMLGNLKMYLGPDAANHLAEYGEFLRHVGAPVIPAYGALWIARLVLLACVIFHIWAAWSLTQMAKAARPSRYEHKEKNHTTYASRTMRWGGVIVLLFIIYHLLDLTVGTVNPSFQEGRPYENLVASFSVWYVALFYIVANVALGLHLYHGVWSLFQSLGWNHPRFNHWRSWFAHAFAWIITLGNVSFPLAVMTGLLK
jgi:succinate dehydrogenase / fumarate reductase cytochrome b subunit